MAPVVKRQNSREADLSTKATFSKYKSRRLLALSLTLVFGSNLFSLAALAAASKDKNTFGSTILLPLTPKIDDNELTADEQEAPSPAPQTSKPAAASTPAKTAPAAPAATALGDDQLQMLESREPVLDQELPSVSDRPHPEQGKDTSTVLEAEASEDDLKLSEVNEPISEDTTLKGVIQIVADDTEYDQDKNTFLGTGNAVAIIGGQNSKLEADTILYDQAKEMIDARGNVKILRNGQLTTGAAFKFKVSSDEYLITNPDTMLDGTQVISRTAYGVKKGMIFKNGTMSLAKPFHIGKNVMFGPVGAGQDIIDRVTHPDAFVEDKPSFVFKARKMVYEKYGDGKVTIFGGKLDFGNFTVPLPKFVATVGVNGENHVMFPVTPMFTSNIQSGGHNVGPAFNYAVGRSGQFSWAPMVQFGGAQTGTSTNGSSIGLSGQIGYSDARLSTHFAYGSVSQLPVGDFKMPLRNIAKGFKFQAGLNRFLTEGLFGYRRAHLLAEFVDDHPVKKQIPFVSGINFRSSAGAMQDNATLVTSNPNLVPLYGNATTTKKQQPSALRIEEQLTASTVNLFALGDDRYGIKSYVFGGVAVGAYSTGNYRGLAQISPQVNVALNRIHLNAGYTQAAIRGSSPFYFDQYLQGSRSVNLAGDIKVAKWLRIGGGYGYNLIAKAAYSKTLTAAFGPDDFKVLVNRDVLNKVNRFGFDILYGQPVPFQKLVLKGGADSGTLGGI
ncbi:MAG: hypothetical protein JST01_04590 [Cyanobacteria bacterium SZAS TMP-1]|nr:hypothetical protein [Cyanobacteria bacterium SZAS TMP-1]